ncbi:MAG: slipin family protein [Candidatus Micrarchaeia archaeon]|jgi:regulator of protease activity HflC (stomatin/prohibitin superfamily)
MILEIMVFIVVLSLLLGWIRIIFEYQRGVLFTLGRYSGVLEPGLRFVIPIIQEAQVVDMRMRVIEVPPQQTITRDNVSINVDAVLYYKITNVSDSVLEIRDVYNGTSQLAQTTMRNVIGEVSLDNLLSERDAISSKISEIVEKASEKWGVTVMGVELKHIELPDNMKRVMAKAAEAERIKRATIIRSQGEADASKVVAKAASLLNTQEGALNLRTLQSLNDIASDQSNEVVFFVPLDVMKNYSGFSEEKSRKK